MLITKPKGVEIGIDTNKDHLFVFCLYQCVHFVKLLAKLQLHDQMVISATPLHIDPTTKGVDQTEFRYAILQWLWENN